MTKPWIVTETRVYRVMAADAHEAEITYLTARDTTRMLVQVEQRDVADELGEFWAADAHRMMVAAAQAGEPGYVPVPDPPIEHVHAVVLPDEPDGFYIFRRPEPAYLFDAALRAAGRTPLRSEEPLHEGDAAARLSLAAEADHGQLSMSDAAAA